MAYTASPRNPRWKDLSEEHRLIREKLEKNINNFQKGEATPPLAIVGAYGSGKSELLNLGFRKSWNLGIPTLYANLEELLENIPDTLSPGELTEKISQLIHDQIELIKEKILNEETSNNELFLANIKKDEKILEYFESLKINEEIVKKALESKKAILLLDEMEQHYRLLLETVPSDDRAPLRDLLEKIGNKSVSFYLIMSYGLTSAYESLSGAESRRRSYLYVPLPNPSDFAKYLLGNDKHANLLWWACRGRPGWLLPLWDSWEQILNKWENTRLEDLYPTLTQRIEGLPFVNLGNIVNLNTDCLELLKRFVFIIGPQNVDLEQNSNQIELFDEFRKHFYLLASENLIDNDTISDSLIDDFIDLYEEYKTGDKVSGFFFFSLCMK